MQVKAYGGLSEVTKRHLREIAAAARDGTFDVATVEPRIKSGTKLIRTRGPSSSRLRRPMQTATGQFEPRRPTAMERLPRKRPNPPEVAMAAVIPATMIPAMTVAAAMGATTAWSGMARAVQARDREACEPCWRDCR
jgi:hypothetical protein